MLAETKGRAWKCWAPRRRAYTYKARRKRVCRPYIFVSAERESFVRTAARQGKKNQTLNYMTARSRKSNWRTPNSSSVVSFFCLRLAGAQIFADWRLLKILGNQSFRQHQTHTRRRLWWLHAHREHEKWWSGSVYGGCDCDVPSPSLLCGLQLGNIPSIRKSSYNRVSE
jgi:hypothetical protein